MSDIVYTSRVKVERVAGPLRRAWLPSEPNPVYYSVHGEIAEHYKVGPGMAEAHATTIDYLVGSAAG